MTDSFEQAKGLFFEGLDCLSQGKFDEAESKFRASLQIIPNAAPALVNLSATLIKLRRFDEAKPFCLRAIELDKNSAKAWVNIGLLFQEENNFSYALNCFDNAIELDVHYVEAISNKGVILHKTGRLSEALVVYDQALAINPRSAEAWSNKGVSLHALGRYREALVCFKKALGLAPDYFESLAGQGITLAVLQRYDEALASFSQALAINAANPDVWVNKGALLNDVKRHEDAIACYDMALVLNPKHADAWLNKGVALSDLNRYEEALAFYDKSLGLNPQRELTWSNQGAALADLRHYDEALFSYEKALAIAPEFADAHWNESLVRLVRGEWKTGWAKYEYRWHKKNHESYRMRSIPPLKSLAHIAGQKVLIWAEQGLGDTIQFCRYIPLLARLGAEVVFEVQPALKGLMASLGDCAVFAIGERLPEADVQSPLLSLPHLFGTELDSIPGAVPYLSVAEEQVGHWREKLRLSYDKVNIGFACSGTMTHKDDARRSMPMELFAPLLDVANLFLIQKEIRADDQPFLSRHPQVRWVGEQLRSFEDSAAVVENMDLIVSVDTSLAHLAGALGKPVCVLLSWCPEWRWLLERKDSPWYPSARLLRQHTAGDWAEVIRNVVQLIDRRTPTPDGCLSVTPFPERSPESLLGSPSGTSPRP